MVEIREILCPTDFSEASRHALDHAMVISQWDGSRITALHVIHNPLVPEPPPSILVAGVAGATATVTSTFQVCEEDVRAWDSSQHDEPVSGLMCRSTKGTPPAGFSNTRSRGTHRPHRDGDARAERGRSRHARLGDGKSFA